MKAFANPLLLIICILLLTFGQVVPAAETSGVAETWALTLCLLGVIINGTLGTARAMSGYPSVQPIGWAVGFLVFGGVVWTLVSAESMGGVSSQERLLLRERVKAWHAGELSPYAMDENGDCVLTLAAGLGKEDVVSDLFAEAPADIRARAAHRAAERNRTQVLRALHAAGLPMDARVEGLTPLHAAVFSKAHRAAACLLELGAPVNAADADGATPLHHAVLAEDAAMVRLLLLHGADPSLLDADGRDAASYARSEALIELLEQAAPSEASPQP